jgi:hypothetical protein
MRTKTIPLILMVLLPLITAISLAATVHAQLQLPLQNMMNNTTLSNNSTANVTNLNPTSAANATNGNTTRIITNLTWYNGSVQEQVEQLSPENIQYQQTDPSFAKLAQTTADCLNDYNAIFEKLEAFNQQYQQEIGENPDFGTGYTVEDINRQDLCTDVISQGINQFCESTDFATFDIAKCEEARNMSETYVQVVERVYG